MLQRPSDLRVVNKIAGGKTLQTVRLHIEVSERPRRMSSDNDHRSSVWHGCRLPQLGKLYNQRDEP